MNEKVAINTVNATKETGNLSPINSNSILGTGIELECFFIVLSYKC